MLTKDFKSRPMVDGILRLPFMKQIAVNFIHNKGHIKEAEHIPIKKTNYHKQIKQEEVEKDLFAGLTPSQIMKKKKLLKAEKRERELRDAARANMTNRSKVQTRKMNQMVSSLDRSKYGKTGGTAAMSKSRQFYGGGTIETQHMATGQFDMTGISKPGYGNDLPGEMTIDSVNMNSKTIHYSPILTIQLSNS